MSLKSNRELFESHFPAEQLADEPSAPKSNKELFESHFPEERTYLEKAGRLAAQVGIGAASSTPAGIAYNLAVAPLASKGAQTGAYRQMLVDELEQLDELKSRQGLSPQEQSIYDFTLEQLQTASKSEPFVQTIDASLTDLAGKATGTNLEPEDFAEKAAQWYGFVKDPKKLIEAGKSLGKSGLNAKEIMKFVAPGEEAFRSLGAAGGLQMAESGQLGPLGQITSAVLGDLIGGGLGKIASRSPQETIAKATKALIRPKAEQAAITKDFIQEAKASGLQLNAGSITDSPMLKMIEARLSQSGLTGTALENARKNLTQGVMSEYKRVADATGSAAFENRAQAANAIFEAIGSEARVFGNPNAKSGRLFTVSSRAHPEYENILLDSISPNATKNSYLGGENLKTVADEIKRPIQKEFNEAWRQFDQAVDQIPTGPQPELAKKMKNFVEDHTKSLVKGISPAEDSVINAAEKLHKALSVEGGLHEISVRELMDTKRTLNSVADYEIGRSNFKSAFKYLSKEVDSAIHEAIEVASPELSQAYKELNANYSSFKETFENKNVVKLFEPKNHNYNSIYDSYVSNLDSLKSLEGVLGNSPQGKQALDQIKRDVVEKAIAQNKLTPREIEDLAQALGPEFEGNLREYVVNRGRRSQPAIANQQAPIGITQKVSGGMPQGDLAGRVKVNEQAMASNKLLNDVARKDPEKIMKMMDSVGGIKSLEKALSKSPADKKLFEDLKRFKLDEMIFNNMQNPITDQLFYSKFSKLGSKAADRSILKEILGKDNFDSMLRLQKNAGKIQASANQFLNTSQTQSASQDVATIMAALSTFAGVLLGNPSAGAYGGLALGFGMKGMSELLTDKKFLQAMEKEFSSTSPKLSESFIKSILPSIERVTKKQLADQKGE